MSVTTGVFCTCECTRPQIFRSAFGLSFLSSAPIFTPVVQPELDIASDTANKIPAQRFNMMEQGILKTGVGNDDYLFCRGNGIGECVKKPFCINEFVVYWNQQSGS